MAFKKIFKFVGSEKEHIAMVTEFVVRNNIIVAIVNVKDKCSVSAAQEAKEELDNFIIWLEALKQSEIGKNTLIEFGEDKININDIDTTIIEKITYGPKGSISVGFDKECSITEEELEDLAMDILKQHQKK